MKHSPPNNPPGPLEPQSSLSQREVFHAAMALRSCILDMSSEMPWPPRAHHLHDAAIDIPRPVYNFLAWLIGGDGGVLDFASDDRVQPTPRVHQRVSSIVQDLIYSVRHGNVKPLKHVALSMAVRHLTGSAQLVTILNKFGHCLSYDQVEELDTALAAENLVAESRSDSFLPRNIDQNQPAVFCYDNNDLHEEMLSESGTTHCTNGIVVQRAHQSRSVCKWIKSCS